MFYNDFYNTSTIDTVAVLSVCRSLMNKLFSKQNACAILTCRRNCDTLEQRHVGTAAYWHAPYWNCAIVARKRLIVIRHCLLNFSSPVTIPLAHCILLLSCTGPVLQIVGLIPIHDVGSKIPPVSVWKATSSGTCNCVLNSDELPGITQLCNLYRRYVNISVKGNFARKTNILSFCHNGSIRTCE